MKIRLFRFLFLAAVVSACTGEKVSRYVDPNIGGVSPLLTTKPPTVHRPNSMIRVFPVTKPGLGDRYLSDKIYGFVVNMPAYRNSYVTELMPVSGAVSPDKALNAAVYDHDLEELHPWYHQVILEDHEITADWTTTERAVIYRFRFSEKEQNKVVFRTQRNSSLQIAPDRVISGWEEFQGVRQYFYAEFSQPFNTFGTFGKSEVEENSAQKSGAGIGAYAGFAETGQPVEVRIGISFIDEEQARANLTRETAGKTFDQVKAESEKIWEATLGRISVKGGTERQKRIFYTCLYRSYERMVDISEDGRYFSGYDRQVHAGSAPFYVDDWLWDTFRSLHPLRLILDPGMEAAMVQSYVDMFEQSGWMPGFPQFYGDYPAMIGFHSAALVWDTYQKGIAGFDVEKAYEGLRKNAMEATMLPWRSGPMCVLDSFYHEKGWYPALAEEEEETVPLVHGFEKRQAVALTLEHSYDDWCLAQLAKALNKPGDYRYFMARSQNYRQVYNPATGFMSPKKADGNWVENFNPKLSGGVGARMYFAENNSWIWTFNVMHDIPGLMELMGGSEKFSERLDALFNEPTGIAKWQFLGQFPDASGLNGMFPAGNEPAFHVPYLYNYAGQPWKTQRRIREVMEMWFDDSPLGLSGDEDGGAMCSWYVFSAMGFYPVTPGTGLYAIGSPFFEEITIRLPDGKKFTVKAKDCSKKNKYIQSARLNGQELNRAWITHEEIMNGGTLEFRMGERANPSWGTDLSWFREATAKFRE